MIKTVSILSFLFWVIMISGCEHKTYHHNAIYGKTVQIPPESTDIKPFDQASGNIEWLSKKTKNGIEWYPAKIIYDKKGHMTVIPLKQKIIPGTTSKIEQHCHTNAVGDTVCKLIKTVYDRNGNILKRIILQKQRAIHAPLPGPKPIEIRNQKKNKIN